MRLADEVYAHDGVRGARVENMYIEATPQGPNRDVRFPRPGLSARYVLGDGPIRGQFSKPGVFGGDQFAVSGFGFYRNQTQLGTVEGRGPARFAASSRELVVVTGGKAYLYTADGFAQITDPDLPAVADVAFLGGRFVYTNRSQDRYYWSGIDDAASIDGLAFATAEGAPDPTVALEVIGDELWFFGQASVEPHFQTGDIDAPFQRAQGRSFTRGTIAQASVVAIDNTCYWVGSGEEGLAVFKAAGVPVALVNAAVSRALAACTDTAAIRAFPAAFSGHLFYVVNIPGQGSFAFDLTTQKWAVWSSHRRDVFRARNGLMIDGQAYLGDDETGTVWKWSGSTDGGDPVNYLCSVFVGTKQDGRNANVLLEASQGLGGFTDEALVEMRYSDDGTLWSEWRTASLGVEGRYHGEAIWRGLGMIRRPGRMFEFRSNAPAVFENVEINT